MHRSILILTLVALLASSAEAQAPEGRLRVIVRDTADRAVPFAMVQPVNGAARSANDSGVVEFRLTAKDSLRFVVRRIGFEAFQGWVKPLDGTSDYRVRLLPLVHSLKETRVIARMNEMLERTGFYDRMQRLGMGATASRFITPEELDLRNPSRISQMLHGESFVKVKIDRGRAMLLGRAMNCPMAVLLDGHRLSGMVEEAFTADGQEEIRRMGNGPAAVHKFLQERLSIDELIVANSVVAIEIYASMAAAPVELQSTARSESCGIVALWTGSRR